MIQNIFIIVTSNDSAHEKCIRVKVLNSSKICSEVKVEVGEKKNTPIKYRYSILVLKYSSEVVLLRYYTSLHMTHKSTQSAASFLCVSCYGSKEVTFLLYFLEKLDFFYYSFFFQARAPCRRGPLGCSLG